MPGDAEVPSPSPLNLFYYDSKCATLLGDRVAHQTPLQVGIAQFSHTSGIFSVAGMFSDSLGSTWGFFPRKMVTGIGVACLEKMVRDPGTGIAARSIP